MKIRIEPNNMTISTIHKATICQHSAELYIEIDTDIYGLQKILNSIYEVMYTDDFIATLNKDQIQDIINFSKDNK